VFDNDIILNLYNSTQDLKFKPERDMLLKVSSKEAYGVNMAMKICQHNNQDCISSDPVGNTEILMA
jgi:hypothetical protein